MGLYRLLSNSKNKRSTLLLQKLKKRGTEEPENHTDYIKSLKNVLSQLQFTVLKLLASFLGFCVLLGTGVCQWASAAVYLASQLEACLASLRGNWCGQFGFSILNEVQGAAEGSGPQPAATMGPTAPAHPPTFLWGAAARGSYPW